MNARNSQLKVLYVGQLWHGSTSLQRMESLGRIGFHIKSIDSTVVRRDSFLSRLRSRVMMAVGYPLDFERINKLILNGVEDFSPDIVWIDKGLSITPNTLKSIVHKVERPVIVGYSPDDMAQRHNQSRYFLRGLECYDFFLTTKSYNVSELVSLGARNVFFVSNAYDPLFHRPVSLNQVEKSLFGGPVGFVGAWEEDRADKMLALARNGISVRWWGCLENPGKASRHTNLSMENRILWGEDYAKAISSFDINLCFLRKVNRDLQTTRSIEIPACGGFMLAERTSEHLELFREGFEAEFFSSVGELVDKTRYYLAHPVERAKIANAGYQRCIEGGYSNDQRLKVALEKLGLI